MLTTEVKAVAQRIGEFFLQRNEGNYEKTRKQLETMRIQEILCPEPQKITIKTSRPGLLIGRRGTVIDALTKHLDLHVHIEEITECLYDYLVPNDYSSFDDGF